MVTKKDLIAKVSRSLKMPKAHVEAVVNTFIQEMEDALVNKETVKLHQFGALTPVVRKPHPYKDNTTGTMEMTKACAGVKFTVSSTLKNRIPTD